jgi:hypothetical protein
MALGFIDGSLCGVLVQGSWACGFGEYHHVSCCALNTICGQGTEKGRSDEWYQERRLLRSAELRDDRNGS